MAYTINKFNGTFLVTVQDGTVDTSTDLNLVGKNYAGYGAIENENLVYLLENFANTSPPPKSLSGQIWYDSGNKKLRFYDGTRFRVAGGAEPSTSAPAGLTVGEFWFDTTAKQLYTWTGTDYVLIGPQASPDLGVSGVSAQVVKGFPPGVTTVNQNYTILKLQAGGKVMGVVSQDEFTLDASVNTITGFENGIKKGLTLINTSPTGVTTNSNYFWGTASNTLRFGGELPTSYVKKTDPFTSEVVFKNPGFTLGDNSDLRLFIDGTEGALLEHRLGYPISVRINVSDIDKRIVARFDQDGLYPGEDNAYTLGTAGLRWGDVFGKDIYATLFHGDLTGNVAGNVTGNIIATNTNILVNASTAQIGYDGATLRGNLVGSVTGTLTGTATNATTVSSFVPSIQIPTLSATVLDKKSVPVRDESGYLYATQFIGTANQADRLKINDAAADTDPVYRSAKTTATGNTIAARTAGGNLLAVLFDGTATAARYADLAEKYLSDAEYTVGTVVMIGGEKEITACTWGKRAIGVISENPAFMMNKDLEGGVYVALKGRVPVKVIGRIKKGDDLIATNDGCAMMAVPHASGVFAVALESSDDEGVKVVEALVL